MRRPHRDLRPRRRARDAAKLGVDFLGEIPLDIAIREKTDAGRPPVVAEPDGPHAQAYRELARLVLAKLDQPAAAERRPFPKIVYEN